MTKAALSLHTTSFVQLYSRDYYCRVPERKIASVRLEHSFSLVEPAVLCEARQLQLPGRLAGITEWEGVVEGHPVSLGWDWIDLPASAIRPLMVIAPRTNMKLIDAKGYDTPEAAAAPLLWQLIESLDWQRWVAQEIGRERTASVLC